MALYINHNSMATTVANNLSGHYSRLATSTRRLSTGLRVNSAADDAAGLAIRELQRADIAALQQGARNANDAISLIQTADGALGVIDEKLIRMKELAEQAATGTYDSTQRLMIESEYQQMASEITRIANATDFNGIKLLDGSLSGTHNGKNLTSTGSLKVHFGSGNDSAEDYYYIQIGNCTAAALGVGNQAYTVKPRIRTVYLAPNGDEVTPAATPGLLNLDGTIHDPSFSDDWIQPVYSNAEGLWIKCTRQADPNTQWPLYWHVGTNMFAAAPQDWGPLIPYEVKYEDKVNGVIKNKEAFIDEWSVPQDPADWPPFLVRDTVYEDANGNMYGPADITVKEIPIGGTETTYADAYTVSTQQAAQKALVGLTNAIVSKDKIRAHLGALQNRLENTVSNLTTQWENLQAAESRISDVDVATEMTNFVRNQILTQSAVAMLSQANSMPQMALQLIG